MKRFFKSFVFLMAVHVTALVILTLFRVLLWASVRPQLPDNIRDDFGLQLTAFIRGI